MHDVGHGLSVSATDWTTDLLSLSRRRTTTASRRGRRPEDRPVNERQELLAAVVPYLFMLVVAEPVGMAVYLLAVEPGALETLVVSGVGAPELLEFLLASPGRLVVAGGIAAACLYVHGRWEPNSDPHREVH